MDRLLELAWEEGGIVAVLIAMLVALWIYHAKNSVTSKDLVNQILKRLEDMDRDTRDGVIRSIERLYESQRNTQQAVDDIRREQQMLRWLLSRSSGGRRPRITAQELHDLLDGLDESTRKEAIRRLKEGKK